MITVISPQLNGSRRLVTPCARGAQNMVILDTIFYGFSKSREFSVFSCETHLTLQLFFWRPNSAELWRAKGGRIRISISSATPLSWLNFDLPHRMIGATLSLTRNLNNNQWCDTCKIKWGQLKDGSWHPKAQMPAYWKAVSQSPLRNGITRFYCQPCANEIQNWPDGTFYSLKQQLEDALTLYKKGAYIDEQLA